MGRGGFLFAIFGQWLLIGAGRHAKGREHTITHQICEWTTTDVDQQMLDDGRATDRIAKALPRFLVDAHRVCAGWVNAIENLRGRGQVSVDCVSWESVDSQPGRMA